MKVKIVRCTFNVEEHVGMVGETFGPCGCAAEWSFGIHYCVPLPDGGTCVASKVTQIDEAPMQAVACGSTFEAIGYTFKVIDIEDGRIIAIAEVG